MPEPHPRPALPADHDELTALVGQAELPALLTALAHVTGDLSLLEPDLRPPMQWTTGGLSPHGGMSTAAQQRARELAVQALERFRAGGVEDESEPTPEQLRTLMSFITGDVADEYLPLLRQELGLPSHDGAPAWTVRQLSPERTLKAVVIGAGMSGLAAAHRLRQTGAEVTVIERNADVGGVWFENTYPGCRLDTPNFHYSYSFLPKEDWHQHFSGRDIINDYFHDVAAQLRLRDLIRFRTEVNSADWDEDAARWAVTCTGPEGVCHLTADILVSAVGQLNVPHVPDIRGRERFRGDAWHTARWPGGADLTRSCDALGRGF